MEESLLDPLVLLAGRRADPARIDETGGLGVAGGFLAGESAEDQALGQGI